MERYVVRYDIERSMYVLEVWWDHWDEAGQRVDHSRLVYDHDAESPRAATSRLIDWQGGHIIPRVQTRYTAEIFGRPEGEYEVRVYCQAVSGAAKVVAPVYVSKSQDFGAAVRDLFRWQTGEIAPQPVRLPKGKRQRERPVRFVAQQFDWLETEE